MGKPQEEQVMAMDVVMLFGKMPLPAFSAVAKSDPRALRRLVIPRAAFEQLHQTMGKVLNSFAEPGEEFGLGGLRQ